MAFWNAVLLLGIFVGFASAQKPLSPDYCVPIGIFVLGVMNVTLLVVRPRLLASKAAGDSTATAWRLFFTVIRERLLIVFIVVFQLIGTSRSMTTAVKFMQGAHGNYAHGLPNASTITHRMIVMSLVMAGVGLTWMAGAIGLWIGHSLGWWLAVVLNALAATVAIGLQFLNWHTYIFDVPATAAVVLLVLPSVRNQ